MLLLALLFASVTQTIFRQWAFLSAETAVLYFLTHIAKDNLNTGFGRIHGSWSNSMHSAETPINSPRKPSGSILITCLMRKVHHVLWQTPGKLYRLLMSHFHSLPSQLSAARSLVLLLRKRWRGEEATQVWAGLDHRLLHHVQKMSVQEPRFSLGSADKVTAPRDAGTAVFCTGNSMDGYIFFRWRKK